MAVCERCGVEFQENKTGRPRRFCLDCRPGSDRSTAPPSKTTPCAKCGRPMWTGRGSLPEGQATCRPCRRESPAYKERVAKAAKWVPLVLQCPVCGDTFTQHQHQQKYCGARCRESLRGWTNAGPKSATTDERGYGKEHREARAAMKREIEACGGIECCLCGEWIRAIDRWHLDHTPDRSGYRGAAHPECNVRDGASRGASRSNKNRRYEKQCPACGGVFVSAYPKQTYCSPNCRPKQTPREVTPTSPKYCVECGVQIKQGKRCAPCGRVHNTTRARNEYRNRVGIPLDAPKYDRTWRAA